MSNVSRYELRLAYEDCMRRKRRTTNATLFEIDDNVLLEELYKELNTRTYEIGKSIVFVLQRDDGTSYREVFAADFKDRIVHHLIINRIITILEKYGFIDDSYACRVGKGTLYGAKRCKEHIIEASHNGTTQNMYLLKGDLKNCFNSFNKLKIYNALEEFLLKYDADNRNLEFNLWLLKKIIMHCPQHKGNHIRKQPKYYWASLPKEKSMFFLDDLHGIPVGNLSSQIFANFLLSILDKYIIYDLGYENKYGRYVDDFYMIGYNKKQLIIDYNKICYFCENVLDIKVNRNKLYLQYYSKGIPFIGYFIYYNRIYIKNVTKYKFFKLVHSIRKYVETNYLRHNISLIFASKMMASWNSYIGMLKHVNGYNIYKKTCNMNTFLVNRMKYIFKFSRNGSISLNSSMKKLQRLYYMFGIKKIKVED